MQTKEYQLIAFDLDGTLLTGDKRVLPETREAIRAALGRGKRVVFCTGRNLSALWPYHEALPEVPYAVCSSGAMLYDFLANRPLYTAAFEPALVRRIAAAARMEDCMVLSMENGHAVIEQDCLARLGHYRMAQYAPLISSTSEVMPDLTEYLMTGPAGIEKINLFHATTEGRARSRRRLLGLPLEMADSEETSLELSPGGVHKGSGLTRLCALLSVPMEAAIGVGDADNDLTMLSACGLAVAMGNANENARREADVIVADNEHGGCAEAIGRFLLGREG